MRRKILSIENSFFCTILWCSHGEITWNILSLKVSIYLYICFYSKHPYMKIIWSIRKWWEMLILSLFHSANCHMPSYCTWCHKLHNDKLTWTCNLYVRVYSQLNESIDGTWISYERNYIIYDLHASHHWENEQNVCKCLEISKGIIFVQTFYPY